VRVFTTREEDEEEDDEEEEEKKKKKKKKSIRSQMYSLAPHGHRSRECHISAVSDV
jgi:hypothetical protein